MAREDLLGRPMTPDEGELLDIYQHLKRMAARDDLAPCVQSNARIALAALWQIVTDLDLSYEQVYDLGV